jgi:hypothetical protein
MDPCPRCGLREWCRFCLRELASDAMNVDRDIRTPGVDPLEQKIERKSSDEIAR